jgi:mRNA interferase MazF
MVTSAENRRWPGDVSLEIDHDAMGLPAPSLARTAKIATIEAAQAEWRGDIPAGHLADIRIRLRENMELAGE